MSETPGTYTTNGTGQGGGSLAVQKDKLNLNELHEAVNALGGGIPRTTLSEFCNKANVTEILGVTMNGNRKEYPRDAALVIAEFRKWIKAKNLKWEVHAPDMLGQFLTENPKGKPGGSLSNRRNNPTEPTAAELAAIAGREQGLAANEEILTAEQVAERLQTSARTVRKTFKPYLRMGTSSRGDRFRWSDIVRGETLSVALSRQDNSPT